MNNKEDFCKGCICHPCSECDEETETVDCDYKETRGKNQEVEIDGLDQTDGAAGYTDSFTTKEDTERSLGEILKEKIRKEKND